ncbi:nucleotidyltransferase substrate binding protein [Candidatus Uhrbacteria bacterium]|nr:nucleotidyltransferase substrate binding protein [Candidatus Uhrbacteria bacterium]
MTKYEATKNDFATALARLKEVLALPKTAITRDSAIQRFEFTLDLAWKTTKTFLEEYRGIRCASPKNCFKEAFQQGLIDHDPFWLDLVDLRNDTVYTYKEELAESVFRQLPRALEYFDKLFAQLENERAVKGVRVKGVRYLFSFFGANGVRYLFSFFGANGVRSRLGENGV